MSMFKITKNFKKSKNQVNKISIIAFQILESNLK